MEKIVAIFKEKYGYADLKDLKTRGIHTDTIRQMLKDRVIEKVKPGLYKLVDMPMVENQGMIDVCMAMPKAIVCLHSALAFYDLTMTVPQQIMIALPRHEKPVKIEYPPIRVFYFSMKNHQNGFQVINTKSGQLKIYDPEKTIIDCFRYRNKLGFDIALEGLKNYLNRRDYNLLKMENSAKAGRMYKVMKPYLEALIHQ